jgi:multidrug resistance protein
MLSSPFTSSVFAPAIPDIMTHFHSTNEYISSFVLSIYVLGYAVGPLLISPLSEIFGRVPLYHFCNTAFTLYTLCCAYSDSLSTIALVRFFAGVGGSSVFALAPSSIADMIPKEKRGAVMALIAIGYNLGPAVSPTVGSYVNAARGWKWIFYLTAILGGSATLLSYVCLSETYEPVLLQRKAARLRKETGNLKLRSKLEVNEERSRLQVLQRAMSMPLRMLFFSPSIFMISLLTAIGYGFIYILYTTLPYTFLIDYEWAPKKIGLAYLGTAVGNLLGMVAGGGFSDAIVKRRAAKGDTRPENRLIPMIFFWPLVSIGLVVYAWTAQHSTHWIGPLVGSAIFGAGAMSAM